ncbi:Kelch-like protein diablo [Clonorchis sinensis]|uniref:Kelch-like protein diablo n=1 Tax=Clonorchis sinensis TaxID=79923 RepID=A0A419QFM3_CLOSI|nr:Kelch-like protein diablo [Clonorchis sinensis]
MMQPMEVDLHSSTTGRNISNFRPNIVVSTSIPNAQLTTSSGTNGSYTIRANADDPRLSSSDQGLNGLDNNAPANFESGSFVPDYTLTGANTSSSSSVCVTNTSTTTTTSTAASVTTNHHPSTTNNGFSVLDTPIASYCGSQPNSSGSKSGQQPSVSRLAYSSDRHPQQSLEAMNCLRKNRELCDVVLLVDGREIFTHRVVLAACSAYFRAMFTGELAESRQTEITLYDLDGDAVEMLVDFCYTSHITVEECNVQNLLPAACLLQLTEVQDVCCEFLKRQLDPSNCLGIRAFADTHACRGLLRVADRYTQLNFLEVMESEEFLLLPVKQLADILGSDELNVRSEEQVYRAVMRWLHHNLSERRHHLPYLLQHVRLPLLAPKFLVGTVGSDLLVRSDERCRDLVDEAKNYLLLPQERPLMQGPRTKPRKPVHTGELLFAVGGWCSGDAIASAEHYDPRTHEWYLVAPMHKRRCGVGVGVVNDLLYAVGGHDGQSYLNSVERYDPHTNQWCSDIAPTTTCRTSVGVAVLNGFMYAVGGQDGVTCLNFVERYDPVLNKWTKLASMASRRLGVGVAVLNGQLYAVGGSDGQQPLASVEHYDPRVGNWHRVPCMGTRRKHLGVAVYNGLIYAVGGRDEITELSSAECFDPRNRTWSPVVAMTSRRSGVGLAVVSNQLIAIGGFDGATYLKTVEFYDPDTNCWRLRGSMNSRRLGGGVGVVRLASSSWEGTVSNFGVREDGDLCGTTPKSVVQGATIPLPPGLSVSVMNQSPGSPSSSQLPNSLTSSMILLPNNTGTSSVPQGQNIPGGTVMNGTMTLSSTTSRTSYNSAFLF